MGSSEAQILERLEGLSNPDDLHYAYLDSVPLFLSLIDHAEITMIQSISKGVVITDDEIGLIRPCLDRIWEERSCEEDYVNAQIIIESAGIEYQPETTYDPNHNKLIRAVTRTATHVYSTLDLLFDELYGTEEWYQSLKTSTRTFQVTPGMAIEDIPRTQNTGILRFYAGLCKKLEEIGYEGPSVFERMAIMMRRELVVQDVMKSSMYASDYGNLILKKLERQRELGLSDQIQLTEEEQREYNEKAKSIGFDTINDLMAIRIANQKAATFRLSIDSNIGIAECISEELFYPIDTSRLARLTAEQRDRIIREEKERVTLDALDFYLYVNYLLANAPRGQLGSDILTRLGLPFDVPRVPMTRIEGVRGQQVLNPSLILTSLLGDINSDRTICRNIGRHFSKFNAGYERGNVI